MQAVILAGGLATRLGARTEHTPKILLPVAGRPFAAWLLEALVRSRFDEALLLVGHLGDAVRAALGDGSAFGLGLAYRADGPVLLGTGGALRAAADGDALRTRFVVTYGDALLPFDYASPLADLETHPEALGTMAVYRNDNRFDRSNVRLAAGGAAGPLVAEYRELARDAPADPGLHHIDYGAIALRREALALLPPEPVVSFGALQARLAREGRLRALEVETRFFEIGSPAGLAALEDELRRRGGAA
ncbi:MAG: NTP transferase domain-containing protein [Myxococcales bacterium]|nr:NTP transferase domain-containing protein [Myxococcales bacterium]